MAKSDSFTIRSVGGALRVLITLVDVLPAGSASVTVPGGIAFHPDTIKKFHAIWDTGATNSVITQSVVDACGLKPTGMTLVHGVNGRNVVETYLVNVGLPNRILFTDVKVTKGVLQGGGDGDLLIGMDIIGMGDFAVSSKGGNTVFTFRFPSIADIDFVKEHDARLQAEALRGSHSRKSKKKAGKQFGRSK